MRYPWAPPPTVIAKYLMCFWFSTKNGQAGGEGKALLWTGKRLAAGLAKPPRPHACPSKGQEVPQAVWGAMGPHTHGSQKAGSRAEAGGHAWGPAWGHCCPRSVRDHPQAPNVLCQVLSEANCFTSHVSPAQGPPGRPQALRERVL